MIQPCRVLADAGIGIHTLTLADTQQFGLLRLIVTDWETGPQNPRTSGISGERDRSVAVEVADRPADSPGCSISSRRAASTSNTCTLHFRA